MSNAIHLDNFAIGGAVNLLETLSPAKKVALNSKA